MTNDKKSGDEAKSCQDSGIDRLSPYYLSPSDNPGQIITHVQLKGENYDEWARMLRGALRAKAKTGFIDGLIKRPTDTEKLEIWYMVNSMIVSWIFNTIEPTLRSTITYVDEANVLWDDLEQRFSVGNGPRVQQLKSDLANCKQMKNESVAAYYGRMKKLLDELNDIDRLPVCSCAGCTCNISKKLVQRREDESVHQFVMGLDSKFENVRSTILNTEPLPNLNKAYANVVREESVKSSTRDDRPEPMSFVARTSAGPHHSGGERFCTHCKKKGHKVENCWEIIGYPERRGDRPRTGTNQKFRTDQPSHSRAGDGKQMPNVRANTVQTGVGISQTMTDAEKAALLGISCEQIEQFRSFLQTQPTNNDQLIGKANNEPWIIDSGATRHITGNYTLLENVRRIEMSPVGLPNGASIMATHEGDVSFRNKFTLKDVLFVPKFNCNLLSVYQLASDSNVSVQFTNKTCVIQDQALKKPIGAGEQSEGLYFFRDLKGAQVCAAKGIATHELWHRRLGHPSNKVVNLLPFVSSNSSLKECCEICCRAKQTRDKFLLSENNAVELFELIHCDLWGDYRTPSTCGATYFLTIVDDYSRGVWVYLVTSKSDVPRLLKSYFAMIDRQFNKRVKVVRIDNGTEFTCMKDYFLDNGILHQTTCVGTSQQNGRVERKHRHILNVARALMFQANLSIKFWGECVLAAGYLINRTPSILLQGQTPFEKLFGKPPSYKHIRVFGCLCYAHHSRRDNDKFASRSRKCIFVGYPNGKVWPGHAFELIK